MRTFTHALVALALAAGSAGAQDSASTALRIDVDRIVAVVGQTPILWSEVLEQVNIRRARGIQMPTDPAEQLKFARDVLGEMIDVEVMVQKARTDTSIVVTDADITENVEQRLKQLRGQFKSDQELAQALKGDGFGTVEEYRRWMMDQARRATMQQRLVQKLRQDGKMVTVGVSEAEITEAFEREKARLPKRPATVTFRQIVVPTTASEAAKKVARAKADSILKELLDGGDFEKIAKRESMDSASAVQGGDLGWNRRGAMVQAFDEMMFYLPPGQVSPLVETQFGFHIIRVDRVQPSERKARHILIKPTYNSTDVERARLRADSVLAQWKAGVPYDTLVARYHDIASDEARGVLEPFERSRLPESYQQAFTGKVNGDFVAPFPVEDRQRGVPKFVVAQLITASEEGDYTVQDLRNQIRDQLSEEKSMRRLLDALRKETFVGIMLDTDAKKVASP
ncbi:MAG: peptidylprolyl isomerase [Gemmatimonadaceae bacterium]|nr:peptidylprolyl isomerase [Gemmatimonadaceae bacterium]